LITLLRPLLLLCPDRLFEERVRRATRQQFQLLVMAGWDDLAEGLRKHGPAPLVVVDPYVATARGEGPSPRLRALIADYPSATFVAAMSTAKHYRDIRTLGAWGVGEVISLDEDTSVEAIAQRLRSTVGRPLETLLESMLPSSITARGKALLRAAVDVVCAGGRGEDLARSLFFCRRHVLRNYDRAGLPPPRRLMAWIRVLLAAEMLDDPGRDVAGIAWACGYSSDNALRTAISLLLGSTPRALRKQGAFAVAAEKFLHELETYRARKAVRAEQDEPEAA
jgi:AraC-like DNA-binding protein